MKIIDIHTHGIGGFDTLMRSEEDILKIAEIHGSLGVSEIIPTVYPSSIAMMRENMLAIKKAMELQKAEGRGQRSEAKIIGVHLEGPFLNPAKCGALDADALIQPDSNSLAALLDDLEDIVKIMTIAPELEGALDLIKKISEAGIIASMGHSDATYSEAEAGFHAGARGITHIFNAMRGLHHREPGLAGFGLMNKDIYIEVIADLFHLDLKMIELVFSVKNPERIIIISDTVKASKAIPAPDGIRNEEDRLIGGSMTIKESADRLIQLGLPEAIIKKAISENPETYLNTYR